MVITEETTVKSILDIYPEALKIFEAHGVDVPAQCDESILDTELGICDSMCHVDDLPKLIRDLQTLVDTNSRA
ncbi:MAG: hypothetical protein U0103_23220 [Candidatus Obscuribacterales bacterium]